MLFTDDYQTLTFNRDRTDREEMKKCVDEKTLQFVAMALANAMISRGELDAVSGGISFLGRHDKKNYDRIMDDALVAVYSMTFIKETK